MTAPAPTKPNRQLNWHFCWLTLVSVIVLMLPGKGYGLTIGEVARDLACPCECPLILEDCNMTCGLDWKEEIGKLIKSGKTKKEIMDYFIATYGEEALLTTLQRINGKIFQYTRGFGTVDWALLWSGIAFWVLMLMGGSYYLVRRYLV